MKKNQILTHTQQTSPTFVGFFVCIDDDE